MYVCLNLKLWMEKIIEPNRNIEGKQKGKLTISAMI